MLYLNCKHYPRGLGQDGELFFQKIEYLLQSKSYQNRIVIMPAPSMLSSARAILSCKIFAQSVDLSTNSSESRQSGFLNSLELSALGINGVMLNHAEHPLTPEELTSATLNAKKNNLEVIIGCASLEQGKLLKPIGQTLVYEDPKLISTDNSVFDEHGEKLKGFITVLDPIKVLFGAGINSPSDVKNAYEFGAIGVLLSSYIMEKVADPIQALDELLAEVRNV